MLLLSVGDEVSEDTSLDEQRLNFGDNGFATGSDGKDGPLTGGSGGVESVHASRVAHYRDRLRCLSLVQQS